MKNCPKCGELIGDNVRVCFNCHYDNVSKTVIDQETILEQRKKEKQLDDLRRKREEDLHNLELKAKNDDKILKEKMKSSYQSAKVNAADFVLKNAFYEYETVGISDLPSGVPDIEAIQRSLSAYAKKGWKLHTSFSKEIGVESSSAGFGGLSSGTNATRCMIVLIFERLIKPDEH